MSTSLYTTCVPVCSDCSLPAFELVLALALTVTVLQLAVLTSANRNPAYMKLGVYSTVRFNADGAEGR